MRLRPFWLNKADLVTSAVCLEPKGLILRSVFAVAATSDLEDFLWEKLRGIPSMFSATPLTSKEPLQHLYNENAMWMLVDTVGLVGIDMRTVLMPNIHVVFWDKRLRGREPIGRAICDWVLEFFSAPVITTQMPASSKATLAWTKRVGFEITGWHSCSTYDSKGELDDLVELAYRGD